MGLTETIKDISRREVEAHVDKRLIGITASAPIWKDQNGVFEFVVDVRVGNKENQGLVEDVLIASWAIGIVNDFNVPVLMERSEGGRLTIVGRSEIRLPNITLTTYSYGALELPFAANRRQLDDGTWVDGFGYPAQDPNGVIQIEQSFEWQQGDIELGIVEGDLVEDTNAGWVQS